MDLQYKKKKKGVRLVNYSVHGHDSCRPNAYFYFSLAIAKNKQCDFIQFVVNFLARYVIL